MLRTSLRNVLAHKLRLAMSGLAIVLGVAFVAGTLVFTDTLGKTFDDLFSSTSADVTVTKHAAFDTGFVGTTEGDSRALTVPASVVERVRAVPGVAEAAGYVESEGVYVLGRDGKVVGTGGAPGVGASWDTDRELSAMHLVRGAAPQADGEIALDVKTVDRTGYRVGDTVRVLTPKGSVATRLVGVFRFGESGGLAGASLTAFPQRQAQQLFGTPGAFSGVSVAAGDGVDQVTLKQRIAGTLGDGYTVKTRDEQAKDAAGELSKGLRFIDIFLLVFAGVALFVGSFLILNTFSMLVAQRTRELALLRALGASRGQVTRSVLAEAVLLGVVGSTVGLGVGFGVAAGLRAIFGSFGLTLDGSLVFSGRTVLWAYLVGVIVTSVAAYVPARRAAKVPPVAAMRTDLGGGERSLRRRSIAGAAVGLLGVAALAAGLPQADSNAGRAASLVGLGSLALIVAAIVLGPVLSTPFLRLVGGLLPRLWGRTGALARENAVRSPRRTAATASALMIGLTLVTAFSVVGSSTNASVDKQVNESLGADFVVSSANGQPFTATLADQLRAVPGVAAVTQQRYGQAKVDGRKVLFSAVDADTLDRSLKLDYVAGSTAGLRDGGLLVDEPTAQSRHLRIGQRLPVLFQSGDTRSMPVAGIYRASPAVGSYVLPADVYAAAGGGTQDQYVYVDLADGTSPAAARAGLQQVVDPYPVVSLKDQTEFKQELKDQVNQLLVLVDALLVLSILIAVLGIVNTLAMSVVERTREIGLLRAVGMVRRQVRRMVRLESVVISVYGAVLGVVLGLVFGISLVKALGSSGLSEVAVPVGSVVGFVVLAAVVGVLAAIWPARRAAKLDVLQAIATE